MALCIKLLNPKHIGFRHPYRDAKGYKSPSTLYGWFICLELSNTNIQKDLVMGNKMEEIVRESLADVLGFLGYKVRKGSINFEDVESLKGFIARGCGVKATVKELAEYYGQSEDNVRHVIHRNLMSPPQRKVYYDFAAFSKVVPKKWQKKIDDQ